MPAHEVELHMTQRIHGLNFELLRPLSPGLPYVIVSEGSLPGCTGAVYQVLGPARSCRNQQSSSRLG
jgi:hypothetical protein